MVVTWPRALAAKVFLALGLVWMEKPGALEESAETLGLEENLH